MLRVNVKNFILARAKAGLTTKELAKKAKLGRATVSKMENGHIQSNLLTIGKVAKALDVPVEYLIIFEE